MQEETKRFVIGAVAAVLIVCTVMLGLVTVNKQSNEYWQPIVKACTERGGTMVTGACYGGK